MSDYLTHRDHWVDFSIDKFEKIIKAHQPIERYVGLVFFRLREFYVFKKVFIPRWETEQIVDICKDLLDSCKDPLSYIDICSGTGAIGISLLLETHLNIRNIQLLDISKYACRNIKKNLKKYQLDAEVINSDWLTHLKTQKYQLITANFPYVDASETEDTIYDPKRSLFASNKGLEHYQLLLDFLIDNKYWTIVVCECSEYHQSFWFKAKEKYPFSIKEYLDGDGKFRFVAIVR